jgi:hypothetical protein
LVERPLIVGISGLAGSGKDTAASFLVRNHSFVRIGVADVMKRFCKEVLDFDDKQLWGSSLHRNAGDGRYTRPDGVSLSARHALQLLGTEWGRECYPDVWIEYALRVGQTLLDNPGMAYTPEDGLHMGRDPRKPYRGVVFSDIRFKNEMAAVREAGGFLARLRRGSGLPGSAGKHATEAEQMAIPDTAFDYVLDNETASLNLLENRINSMHKFFTERLAKRSDFA